MSDILPCLICGSHARLISSIYRGYMIECIKCQKPKPYPPALTVSIAIEQWNLLNKK